MWFRWLVFLVLFCEGTTTTTQPTTTNATTTESIPTTTLSQEIDMESPSNCSIGMPFACFIYPNYQYPRRCECLEGTSLPYLFCPHRARLGLEFHGKGVAELIANCNFTNNQCDFQKPGDHDELRGEDIVLPRRQGMMVGQSIDCWIRWEPQSMNTSVIYPIVPNSMLKPKCDPVKDLNADLDVPLAELPSTFLIISCYLPLCKARNRFPALDKKTKEGACIGRIPDPFTMTWTRQWCPPYFDDPKMMDGDRGCEPLPLCDMDTELTDELIFLPAVSANLTEDVTMCERLCLPGAENHRGFDNQNRMCRRLPTIDHDAFKIGNRLALPWCEGDENYRIDPSTTCNQRPPCGNIEKAMPSNPFLADHLECLNVTVKELCTPNEKLIFKCGPGVRSYPEYRGLRAIVGVLGTLVILTLLIGIGLAIMLFIKMKNMKEKYSRNQNSLVRVKSSNDKVSYSPDQRTPLLGLKESPEQQILSVSPDTAPRTDPSNQRAKRTQRTERTDRTESSQ